MSSVQSTDRKTRQNVGNGLQGMFADRDAAFTLLSSRRRRNIIHALMHVDSSTVYELARQLAGWETGKTPEAVSSKERKRTYTALRQTHLPKLADHDVVAYDANRGTVSLTERGEPADEFEVVGVGLECRERGLQIRTGLPDVIEEGAEDPSGQWAIGPRRELGVIAATRPGDTEQVLREHGCRSTPRG